MDQETTMRVWEILAREGFLRERDYGAFADAFQGDDVLGEYRLDPGDWKLVTERAQDGVLSLSIRPPTPLYDPAGAPAAAARATRVTGEIRAALTTAK